MAPEAGLEPATHGLRHTSVFTAPSGEGFVRWTVPSSDEGGVDYSLYTFPLLTEGAWLGVASPSPKGGGRGFTDVTTLFNDGCPSRLPFDSPLFYL